MGSPHFSSRMAIFLAAVAADLLGGCGGSGSSVQGEPETTHCRALDPALSLPEGFCATVFADNLGHVRHMAVAVDGTLYVNSWSGSYYPDDTAREGGFLAALKDADGDGVAEIARRFGPGMGDKVLGGTGVQLVGDWLYAEVDDRIVR